MVYLLRGKLVYLGCGPLANEGLVLDSLLKMKCHPNGDDCILGGGHTQSIPVQRSLVDVS